MIRWVLAAGLLAAAMAPALAADLDDEPSPPWKGGAYGDPRFPPHGPPPGYYDDEDDDDGPPAAKRYTETPPYGPPPKKYTEVPPPYAPPPDKYTEGPPYPPPKGACVRSEQVRDRLTSLGWRDFHEGKAVSPTTVVMRARRPSGRLFELRLDRCSGEVVAVRPLELRPFGPYAYRQPYGPDGSWRWGPESPPYAYGGAPYDPYAYRGPRRWYGD